MQQLSETSGFRGHRNNRTADHKATAIYCATFPRMAEDILPHFMFFKKSYQMFTFWIELISKLHIYQLLNHF